MPAPSRRSVWIITKVAIPLFPRFTALDAVGPYEVLQRIPDIEVTFVGAHRGEVRSDTAMLGMICDATFAELPRPDVIVFPGGAGTRALIDASKNTSENYTAPAVLDWLRNAHPHTTFTTSVCTGALVLAAAGLLPDMTATTHWRAAELLERLGAHYLRQRVVEHLPERIITAAGVSAGIDMALRLVELLVDADAARAAQLMIEYDPQPPFDAGAWGKADATVRHRALEYFRRRPQQPGT